MTKEQLELLDEAYQNYLKNYWEPKSEDNNPMGWMEQELVNDRALPKDWFVNDIKTDNEFAKKWNLKIEERKLALEERLLLVDKICKEIRQDLYMYSFNNPIYTGGIDQRPDDVERHDLLSELNIPTKLITVTYNNKKIESYE